MSDRPFEIIKLLSVTLTREKQDLLNPELEKYAAATNYAIKEIIKKHISSNKQAHDLLHDEIVERFLFSTRDEQSGDVVAFGRRFKYSVITKYIPEKIKVKTQQGIREIQRTPEEMRQEFALTYAEQYVNDILKTASVEITRHRKLAKTLVSIRGKPPHFREGMMIISGLLLDIGERTVNLLTRFGDILSIPYDKRSRNRELETLKEIAEKKRDFERVRLTWNKEGFLNVDIRLPKN